MLSDLNQSHVPAHAETPRRKKLIEVALPLAAINASSLREKNGISHCHGHPSTLHYWWAPRPLVACRALLFASLVDDPSADTERFPTPESQDDERTRLFGIIERLIVWENSLNPSVLAEARAEIVRCIGEPLPTVYDPFCGRGAIPIEAQRLGFPVAASDLNPVAVVVAKALIEFPWAFKGVNPVHPSLGGPLEERKWERATGLAADVAAYGDWMLEEARKRIGEHYPDVALEHGRKATVIAWLWFHTMRCNNPVCGAAMPLMKSLSLSTKSKREWCVEPLVNRAERTVTFKTRRGAASRGGTVNGQGAECIVCGETAPLDYLRSEGKAKRITTRLLAIIAKGERGRAYVSADEYHERVALAARPPWAPDTDLPDRALGFRVQAYGIAKHRDLFTSRQLLALTTLSDLVKAAHRRALTDAKAAGMPDDGLSLEAGGRGARAYADAIATYLAIAVDRQASYSSNLCTWNSPGETMFQVFTRQTVSVKWDFAEANPFSDSTGNFGGAVTWVEKALAATSAGAPAVVSASDAADGRIVPTGIFATDPPYYDNVPYSDLSDFFYVWLRPSLHEVFPDLLSTLLTPKAQELIADPSRYKGDSTRARREFEEGLERAFVSMRNCVTNDVPAIIIYAFKQAESDDAADDDYGKRSIKISVGWEAMLSALLKAGFQITGTWPLTTERPARSRSIKSNALASSIALVCRPRIDDDLRCSRADFVRELRTALPVAVQKLQNASLAATDLQQAAIGPGMAVFSKYRDVIEVDDSVMTVRAALGVINDELAHILLGDIADVDAETQFALGWFDRFGYDAGKYGEADMLLRSKNASAGVLRASGVLDLDGGLVQLRDPRAITGGSRIDLPGAPTWSQMMRLIAALLSEDGGEERAAELLRAIGLRNADRLKSIAYHCYLICDERKRATHARDFNALIAAWPDIERRAADTGPYQERFE